MNWNKKNYAAIDQVKFWSRNEKIASTSKWERGQKRNENVVFRPNWGERDLGVYFIKLSWFVISDSNCKACSNFEVKFWGTIQLQNSCYLPSFLVNFQLVKFYWTGPGCLRWKKAVKIDVPLGLNWKKKGSRKNGVCFSERERDRETEWDNGRERERDRERVRECERCVSNGAACNWLYVYVR